MPGPLSADTNGSFGVLDQGLNSYFSAFGSVPKRVIAQVRHQQPKRVLVGNHNCRRLRDRPQMNMLLFGDGAEIFGNRSSQLRHIDGKKRPGAVIRSRQGHREELGHESGCSFNTVL